MLVIILITTTDYKHNNVGLLDIKLIGVISNFGVFFYSISWQ